MPPHSTCSPKVAHLIPTMNAHTTDNNHQYTFGFLSVQLFYASLSQASHAMTSSQPTEEELEKLTEFRLRVGKIYPEPDLKLLSWLRARDLDLAKAEQMLRRHLIWRKNNELDSLRNWKSPKNYFPYIQFGYDKAGAPVYLMPIGHWEIRSCIEDGDVVPCLRYIYQVLENIISTANKQGIYEGTVICDFDGFDYRQIAHRGVLIGMQDVLQIFEKNYPEVLKAAYVINAPKVFNCLFALVKPFLNSHTLSKVQIYGPNRDKWQQVLLKAIESDQIPPHWGGTRVGSDEYCSEDWLTEPLPPNFLKTSAAMHDEYGEEWFTIKVPSKEKLTFEYKVGTNQDALLKWAFYTDGYDIGFAVYRGNNQDDDGNSIVKYSRVNSHVEKEEGSLQLTKKGEYVIVFDNSYSRTRTKTLHYCINFTAVDVQIDKIL